MKVFCMFKTILKHVIGLLFLGIYSIGLLLIVDFPVIYIIAVLFFMLSLFWWNHKFGQQTPSIGWGWKIFIIILFAGIFIFGQVLDMRGESAFTEACFQAKDNNIPLHFRDIFELAGYKKINQAQNGEPILAGLATIYTNHYLPWKASLSKEESNLIYKPSEFIQAHQAKVEELLTPLQNFKPSLELALSMPECRVSYSYIPTSPQEFFKLQMPSILHYRNIIEVLKLQALLEAQKKSWPDVAKTISQMVKIADSIRYEPFLITQMMRISAQTKTVETMQFLIQNYGNEIAPEILQQFQQYLQNWDSTGYQELSTAFSTETVLPIMFGSMDKFELVESPIIEDEPLGELNFFLLFVPHGWIKFDLANMIQDRIQVCQNLKNEGKMREYMEYVASAEYENKVSNTLYFLSYAMIPGAVTCIKQQATLSAKLRSTWIALAIILEQQKTQALPNNLDFIKDNNMSVDPFTGKLLLYEVREKNYVVYSVGADKQDDHGILVPPASKKDEPYKQPTCDVGIEMNK